MAVAGELAGILGFVGALITFVSGKSMLRSTVLHALGAQSLNSKSLGGFGGDLLNAAIDAAYKTLQTRAILAIVVFVVLTSLTIFALRGGTGMRIALTVVLVIGAGIWFTNVNDGGVPGIIRALDGAAMVFALGAIVLAWLPSTRQFAGARKGMRS